MFLARGSVHHQTSGLQMLILGIKVVTSMEGEGYRIEAVNWVGLLVKHVQVCCSLSRTTLWSTIWHFNKFSIVGGIWCELVIVFPFILRNIISI